MAEEVFTAVDQVRQQITRACAAARARGDRLRVQDIRGLRATIGDELRRQPCLMMGLGLVAAPGLLTGAPLRLEWWQLEAGAGEPSRLRVDLNTLSSGFYNYEAADWFQTPRRTGRRHIVGPYVDVGGTGRYLLTFTTPVVWDGRFLGVAGADVLLARLEERLLADLGTSRRILIVNHDGRILFSSCTDRLTGERVEPGQGPETRYQDISGLPWRLGIPD